MKRWLIFILALGCLNAALLLYRPRPDRDQDLVSDQPAETAKTTRPTLQVRPQPLALPRAPRQRTEPTITKSSAQQPTAAAQATAGADVDEREWLETVFERERTDDAWTASARGAFETKLARALPAASKLLGIECRQSLCRIETSHADPDSYQQYLSALLRDAETAPWRAGGFAAATDRYDSAGNRLTVAYLAREGTGLPRPAAN